MPAVVRLKKKTSATKRGVKFSRMNVYLRDDFSCAYCRVKLAVSQLTYDHVIPRAQGGRTEWENIVTACYGCNALKGNRTPDQSGMFPVQPPYKPATLPLLPPFIDPSSAPVEWRDFCVKLPHRPSRNATVPPGTHPDRASAECRPACARSGPGIFQSLCAKHLVFSGRSLVWRKRRFREPEIGGSNPPAQTVRA